MFAAADRTLSESSLDLSWPRLECYRIMSVVIERRVARAIAADLPSKMVLLSGPRQSGKTTLVRGLVDARGGHYYSWDAPPDRLAIQKRRLDLERPLWAFDELHKFRRWRAFLSSATSATGPVSRSTSSCSAVAGRGWPWTPRSRSRSSLLGSATSSNGPTRTSRSRSSSAAPASAVCPTSVPRGSRSSPPPASSPTSREL